MIDPTLQGLRDAIRILMTAHLGVTNEPAPVWQIVVHAKWYLEAQLDALLR